MTKTARRLALKAAAAIIAAELADGQDVRIPGFGLFRVRDRRIGNYGDGGQQTHVIGVVYFRPFSRLKEAVKNLQARCPAEHGLGLFDGDKNQCVLRDDHSCDHRDERGNVWS